MSNKRRNYRGKNSDEKKDVAASSNSSTGGISQLVIDAANISYANQLGAKMTYDMEWDLQYNPIKRPAIPGVLQLNFLPTVGRSEDQTSAINVAARRLYTFVRHANAGHSNYESPDLMLYILAMSSLYTIHAMGVRAYGLMRYYTLRNRYVPRELIAAAGFNANAMMGNLADFRAYLNTLALKLSAMAVPKEFEYFNRHVTLVSNVFADSPNDKAQLYVYNPEAFFLYEGFEDKKGGQLKYYKTHVAGGYTLTTYMATVEEMAKEIFGDEDMNIMSGDILKAYNGEVISVGIIGEDYQIAPLFDMNQLVQINNSVFLGQANVWGALAVGQENGILKADISFSADSAVPRGHENYALVSIPLDNPTPIDTFNATRNSVIRISEGSLGRTTADSFSSEVLTTGVIYTRGYVEDDDAEIWTDVTIWNPRYSSQVWIDVSANPVEQAKIWTYLSQLTKFQMFPIHHLYITEDDDEQDVMEFFDYFGDVDNYAIVHKSTLQKIHDVNLLSLLHVNGVFRRR